MYSEKFIPLFSSNAPSSIVLTKSTAKAIFGNDNPLNKTVGLNTGRDAKVTAVVDDPPGNSTFQFDYVLPFNFSDPGTQRAMTDWTNSSWTVFIQVDPKADVANMEKSINDI